MKNFCLQAAVLTVFILCLGSLQGGEKSPAGLVKELGDAALCEQATDKLYDMADKTLGALLVGLLSENELIRQKCSFLLGKMGSYAGVPLLVIILTNEQSKQVRISIIKSLGEISDLRAFGALSRYAEDPDKEIRSNAVSSLGLLHNERAFPMLVIALMDSEPEVRESAAEALLALGDRRGAYFLERVLKLDESEEVRALAASALALVTGDDSIPHLINALQDKSIHVRSTALRHLRTLVKEDFSFDPLKDLETQKDSRG